MTDEHRRRFTFATLGRVTEVSGRCCGKKLPVSGLRAPWVPPKTSFPESIQPSSIANAEGPLRTAGCFELWPIVLREAVPKVTHLAVLWNPEAGGAEGRVKELRTAAGVLNPTPHIFEARNVNEFEGAFAAMARAHLGGLIVVPDPLTLRHRDQVVRLAAQTRLPATYGFPEFARAGGFGAWWHQQEPILARGRDTVLEEGMVLAVEPITERWYLQDMIVVRAAGPELLSDTFPTDELFVISC
jgi:hypothetical protein